MDILAETLQARKEGDDIFKALKEKNYQARILCTTKSSFKNKGEIKNFPDKKKLREFIISRPALPDAKGSLSG